MKSSQKEVFPRDIQYYLNVMTPVIISMVLTICSFTMFHLHLFHSWVWTLRANYHSKAVMHTSATTHHISWGDNRNRPLILHSLFVVHGSELARNPWAWHSALLFYRSSIIGGSLLCLVSKWVRACKACMADLHLLMQLITFSDASNAQPLKCACRICFEIRESMLTLLIVIVSAFPFECEIHQLLVFPQHICTVQCFCVAIVLCFVKFEKAT